MAWGSLAGCGSAPPHPSAAGPTPRAHGATTTSPPTTTAAPAGAEGVPAFGHVFVVLMENLSAAGATSVASIAALAARYESTTDWYAVSHPSLPNYLALVSGSTWGVSSDCTSCLQNGATIATQLEGAGISWDAYFGGMPGPCFLGPQSSDGSYAMKHDPFAYFTDIRSSPALCAHLQPLASLTPLLSGPATSVPRFVWVTPTMCDSGHDCPASTAGAWLSGFVHAVTASAAWRTGGLLVVTWDEGSDDSGIASATGAPGTSGGGRVLTLVAAPGVPAGRVVGGPFDHYSLLRTVEDAFGLPRLGQAAAPGVRALGAFFPAGTGSG